MTKEELKESQSLKKHYGCLDERGLVACWLAVDDTPFGGVTIWFGKKEQLGHPDDGDPKFWFGGKGMPHETSDELVAIDSLTLNGEVSGFHSIHVPKELREKAKKEPQRVFLQVRPVEEFEEGVNNVT